MEGEARLASQNHGQTSFSPTKTPSILWASLFIVYFQFWVSVSLTTSSVHYVSYINLFPDIGQKQGTSCIIPCLPSIAASYSPLGRTPSDCHMSVRRRRASNSATQFIADVAKKAEDRVEGALTVLWDDLHEWQRDNHYIHSGYRPPSGSFTKSFASLGYLHNESVNIYTHLLGALLFSLSGVVLYTALKPRYETAAPSDVFAFSFFFAGAAFCLTMSGKC